MHWPFWKTIGKPEYNNFIIIMYMNIEIFEKSDTQYNTKTETYLNTDAKVNRLLDGIKYHYSDKESLQDMLDETIKLLKIEEMENDKLRIRCREYIKVIETKHNKIKELEHKVDELENKLKKEFFKTYM